jgi:hypothetical protein
MKELLKKGFHHSAKYLPCPFPPANQGMIAIMAML